MLQHSRRPGGPGPRLALAGVDSFDGLLPLSGATSDEELLERLDRSIDENGIPDLCRALALRRKESILLAVTSGVAALWSVVIQVR